MAGSVDNVNLLEVPVQEMSPYGQDITAATIVLLHCHRLRQSRAGHWCTSGVRKEEEMKTAGRKMKKNKVRCECVWLIHNLCWLVGLSRVVFSQWINTRQLLMNVKFEPHWRGSGDTEAKQIKTLSAGVCLSTYGQELARRHSPQAGFLIRYIGQPYAARAKSI